MSDQLDAPQISNDSKTLEAHEDESDPQFPFTVRPCSEDFERRVAADFGRGFRRGLVRCNHWDFLLQGHVDAARLGDLYRREVGEGDVWVVSLPKCGTTWTQEMVWLLANDLDYEAAKCQLSPDRWEFFDRAVVMDPDHVKELLDDARREVPDLAMTPEAIFKPTHARRRFVQSHLPLSLNPPQLLTKAKVIYVARNPKDMVVSYWHHMRLLKFQGCDADLATFVNYFLRGEMIETPFFPHVLEAWHRRQHPNLCFIFYEDMQRDLPAVIRRVADFLGKSYTAEQVTSLAEHLHVDNFRRNPYVNKEWMKNVPGLMSKEGSFVRRGRTGDWTNHLTPQLESRMDVWMEENLRGTDLKFVDRLTVD